MTPGLHIGKDPTYSGYRHRWTEVAWSVYIYMKVVRLVSILNPKRLAIRVAALTATLVTAYVALAWVVTSVSTPHPPSGGVTEDQASAIATSLHGGSAFRSHLGLCNDIVRGWLRGPTNCGRVWVWEIDIHGTGPCRIIVDYLTGRIIGEDPCLRI
jgi:hypothetical protein